MRLLFVVTACIAFLAGINQSVAQTSRAYLAGYMGLNIYSDLDFESQAANSLTSGSVAFENATSFAGALGLRLSRNVRVEGELSYRKADAESIKFSGNDVTVSGDLTQWMGLLNLYYDFDVPWEIKPFVNAGVGLGYFTGELESPNNGPDFSESKTAVAWTAGAGLKYRPRRDLAFTAGYRYLDSTDLDFEDFDLDYNSHEIRIGIEYDLK